MFDRTAELYDLIYQNKDYAGESAQLIQMIQQHKRSPGNRLLEVACGTGGHIAHLRDHFSVTGMDANENMIAIARNKYPDIPFHVANMQDFDLGETFDVVTCLFSSIGYTGSEPAMREAIAAMEKHVTPGGLLIIEPWFGPGMMTDQLQTVSTVEGDGIKVARMTYTQIRGDISILSFHYLIAHPGEPIAYAEEQHKLGLFTHSDYISAFQRVDLDVVYDAEGLTGRGLYIGIRPS
ncbi:MAG: class I SAM-dependent DNA methyltransferase [Chloroflexota bacterium]